METYNLILSTPPQKKWRYLPYYWSKGFKGTVVNRALTFLHWRSLEITLVHSPCNVSLNMGKSTKLAWEPVAAQFTHISQGVYPHLVDLYQDTKYSLLKSNHSPWNLKTKLRTFPWLSPVPQSKFETNRSRGSWVMIGQTNRKAEILYLYKDY